MQFIFDFMEFWGWAETVDDVPLVEVELKKASVREKAQKVIQSNTSNIWHVILCI